MSNPSQINPSRRAGQLKPNKLLGVSNPAAARGPVPEERRHAMIAIAAYYIAERRGFEAGHGLEDWLRAEREIATARGGGEPPEGHAASLT